MARSTSKSSSVVSVEDLYLSLDGPSGKVEILKGVDLNVGAGEILSIVGPSGSGKTSLLMVVAGLEPATSGQVLVAGKNLANLNEDQLALFRRDKVGIVFQSFHLVPTMSALENVALPMEFAGRKDAFEVAKETLALVGLKDRMHHYPGQLSGGEQQRVGLARAVATKPALILADEPTGNLDGETGALIANLLFDLAREQGTSLVLITHDPKLAARCDRQIHMSAGKIREVQPATETNNQSSAAV
ncbi:MAG: ABC transporter ATP-binding protein [Alphaproteobacteria bacterium]